MKVQNLILCLFISICSCAKKESAQVEAAIDNAHYFLTDNNCSEARAVLDEVGYQATNASYIGAYASSYACDGNYSTINFFANDIDQIASGQSSLMGSLTLFSTSYDMTSSTDSNFVNLQKAINTILYSGDQSESSSANRETVFSIRENTNLNVQALYMSLVNLGRWLRFYGNPDSTGEKGAGAGSNSCLYSYTDSDAITLLSEGSSGSCSDTENIGSADMMSGTAQESKSRLCQGIVLFTNFIDLLANIEFSGDEVASLSSIGDTFEDACDDIADEGYDYCSLRDMSGCEAVDIDELEVFSVLLFEFLY